MTSVADPEFQVVAAIVASTNSYSYSFTLDVAGMNWLLRYAELMKEGLVGNFLWLNFVDMKLHAVRALLIK
jgi:hypothetical protein